MHHPVGGLSLCNQGIQRPGSRPHDIAAGFIILRVLVGDPAGMEQGAHQSFADIIAHVVVLAGEILLADVIKDVIDAGSHLIVRQRQGVFRIQNGKSGHDFLICEDMADFLLGFRIGNDSARVHLGTGACHGQYTAHRQRFTVRFLKAQIIFFPWIFFTVHGNRNCLRIVAD